MPTTTDLTTDYSAATVVDLLAALDDLGCLERRAFAVALAESRDLAAANGLARRASVFAALAALSAERESLERLRLAALDDDLHAATGGIIDDDEDDEDSQTDRDTLGDSHA